MEWLIIFLLLVGAVAAAVVGAKLRQEQKARNRLIARTMAARMGSHAPPASPPWRPSPPPAGPPLRPTRQTLPPPIRPAPSTVQGLLWLGTGQSIHINDLSLQDPLTYFVDSRSGIPHNEPAAINLALGIASQSQVSKFRELPYWPQYGGLNPGQRRYYLEWLAQGRQAMPSELGYVFLFIYGLERRALVDGADQKIVFDEIMRLRQVCAAGGQAPSRSFDSYTTSFLWFLVARLPDVFALKRVQQLMATAPHLTEDHLAAALCWFAATRTPLPDWAAYLLADDLPQSQRSVVTRRVPEELRRLFCKRYREQFGQGMQFQIAGRKRLYSYRPASAALRHMEFSGPMPLSVSRQLSPLSDIWNQCVAELKKLSSVVAKEGQAAMTVAAWEGVDNNAAVLWGYLMKGKGRKLARAIGLVLEEDGPPPTVFRSRSENRIATEVHSVRTALRRSPRGSPSTDLVVEITQRRRGYFDAARQRELDAPGSQPIDDGDFRYRAGCTLLINPATMEVRRVIRTPGTIADDGQLDRVRRFLIGGLEPPNAFDAARGAMHAREPFALLHRDSEA